MENSDRPFHTLEEQVNLLKGKGIIIQNEDYTKNELMKRGYYSLINGYKKRMNMEWHLFLINILLE
ncbi:hypothetical protein [Lactobacillus gallinarum]|uniref:hypothetical protein n=1 Tax=Lactobacillus gallinarum TaxID=52242 RepID=UPI0024B05F62|nr:hypothetical protein [Lactobacillus gallinarum]